MNTSEIFVLANDIEFIPVGSIQQETRRNFEHSQSDVIITHKHTRKRSKVLDGDAASLLKTFEAPRSWAEAILDFALANKKDALQLAEAAFPLLVDMTQQGFLITASEAEKKTGKQTFKIDEYFKEYRIKQKCLILEDTEVYRAEDKEGNQYALKLLKKASNNKIPGRFKNEIEILEKLDGKVNPKLISADNESETFCIITQWCEGANCEQEASKYRNYNVQSNLIKILDLCIGILNAFHHLHGQGIIHGDIHPSNIIVTKEGVVKIIDYGFSASANKGTRIARGGIGFYYEPEFAGAILHKQRAPAATERGEQYSLAVLLYLLISGRHYLNFSFEAEKVYHQIFYETPLSFSTFDLNLPAALDEIFAVAFSKDPVKRFSSAKAFSDALSGVRDNVFSGNDFFIIGKKYPEKNFAGFLVKKFGWESRFIKHGLSMAPTCSVNYGAAGIAYMLYRMACMHEDSQLLDLADVWANRAEEYVFDYDRAFFSERKQITEASVGKRSLYHSPTGVHLVQCLIGYCRGDTWSVRDALKKFLRAANEPCDKIDVALGKAGILIGCSIILNELKTSEKINLVPVISFANTLMEELWRQLDGYPSMDLSNPVAYFGIAHGWGGLLYATLLWCDAAKCQLPKNFENRMQQLFERALKKGDTLVWPITNTDKSYWTGWCHGSAGYIFLMTSLYKYFKEKKFLSAAEQCANYMLQEKTLANANLCCGLTGQMYALMRIHHYSGNRNYLQKLDEIKYAILNHLSSPALGNNSLYKGEVGIGVLLSELNKPELAKMPLFE